MNVVDTFVPLFVSGHRTRPSLLRRTSFAADRTDRAGRSCVVVGTTRTRTEQHAQRFHSLATTLDICIYVCVCVAKKSHIESTFKLFSAIFTWNCNKNACGN